MKEPIVHLLDVDERPDENTVVVNCGEKIPFSPIRCEFRNNHMTCETCLRVHDNGLGREKKLTFAIPSAPINP